MMSAEKIEFVTHQKSGDFLDESLTIYIKLTNF